MTNNEYVIDCSIFPHIVEIEGGTMLHEQLHQISLFAYNWFGHRHGLCIFNEYNCASGRCIDAPYIDYDQSNELNDESMGFVEDYFNWYDENGEYISEPVAEGKFSFLYGAEHSHIGIYASKWIKKSGYDWGIERYYFKVREDAAYFALMLVAHNFKANLIPYSA